MQGRGDDSVVKLRPVVPHELPAELRLKEDDFVVEVDAMPGGFVCNGSYRGSPVARSSRRPQRESTPLSKLFNEAQHKFTADPRPRASRSTTTRGARPRHSTEAEVRRDYGRRLVAEVWVYPDGSHASSSCR